MYELPLTVSDRGACRKNKAPPRKILPIPPFFLLLFPPPSIHFPFPFPTNPVRERCKLLSGV